MYDTGLANRLRKRGVDVVEIGGWQTRGSSSFNPKGSVNHHTAGSASGAAPSLSICIYGRKDLPGPLCHVLLGRDLRAYVIAAGRANHAGTGGWRGLAGNSSVHGLEIEHTGYGQAADQLYVAIQIHAAFLEAPGSTLDPAMVCQHFEWTSRKVDFRELSPWSTQSFRDSIGVALDPNITPIPPKNEDQMFSIVRCAEKPEWYLTDGTERVWLNNQNAVKEYAWYYTLAGLKVQYNGQSNGVPQPYVWPQWMVAILKPRRPGVDDAGLPYTGK